MYAKESSPAPEPVPMPKIASAPVDTVRHLKANDVRRALGLPLNDGRGKR